MKLFHRYIFNAVLVAGLSGVGLFVFVLITGNAVRDILSLFASGQLNVRMFLGLLALLIPYAISFALPMGLLIGILVVLGRMSARREITALKAAGVSIWRISAPILCFACLGVLFSSVINNYYGPKARSEYKSILANIIREDPLRFIVPKTFIQDFPGYVIYVGETEGENLKDFWIWELDDEDQAVRLARAKRGKFTYLENEDVLLLELFDGFTELRSERNPDDLQRSNPTPTFDSLTVRLSLDKILGGKRKASTKLKYLSLPELTRMNEGLKQEIRALGNRIDDAQSYAKWQDLRVQITKVQYQIQHNYSMSFSILALAIIGIPLGIKASRSETYANIAIALALCLVYYMFMILVDWVSATPSCYPQLLVWVPNLAYQGFGSYLMLRSNRH
ncbi:MAG: LptF/LptG family permease [Opitutales bacterium]|nr:LptF/LptG family permease [Opitutales bacterium]